ncbi:MAG: DUF4493 domain-containing protein [Bacteroidales bacterium]|nr:DUF4493 domain-containing protein [Bacteroidales bacterium]
MKKILFSAMMIALLMAACNRVDVNTETPVETGKLSFAVTDLTDYVTVETKSGIDYTDYNNYDVVIEGPTPVSGKYGEMFVGNVVELGSGHYTITVTSPETEPAAFDQPIYRAHEEFEIKAGEVTDLKLTCTPYNCKVTMELSDNFKKELASYEVVVTNGLGNLTWTKDTEKDDFAAGKAGYFLARGLEVKVMGHRSIDNTEATAVYYVKNPQPAEHHIIKLDAKVTGEIGGITIDVVTTFKEEHDEIYVDGMEESYVDRPDFDGSEGEDEEEEKPANSIVWEGNETFEEMVINTESQIKMTITMPAGIETFVIQVSDNFKGAISEITEGNKEYIDLINDSEICKNFADTPLLTGDEIYHKSEIIFDLSTFVPLLCQAAKGMTVQFILEAEDVNGDPLQIFGDSPVVTLTIPE